MSERQRLIIDANKALLMFGARKESLKKDRVALMKAMKTAEEVVDLYLKERRNVNLKILCAKSRRERLALLRNYQMNMWFRFARYENERFNKELKSLIKDTKKKLGKVKNKATVGPKAINQLPHKMAETRNAEMMAWKMESESQKEEVLNKLHTLKLEDTSIQEPDKLVKDQPQDSVPGLTPGLSRREAKNWDMLTKSVARLSLKQKKGGFKLDRGEAKTRTSTGICPRKACAAEGRGDGGIPSEDE